MAQKDTAALFQRTYANLPLNARNEIIVVIDGEPLTWRSAKVEVDNDTARGKQVLDQLTDIKILTGDE